MNVDVLMETMGSIASEFRDLQAEASELQSVYGAAAAASDLTFIKILEQKYRQLAEEFQKLGDDVGEVRDDLEKCHGGDERWGVK